MFEFLRRWCNGSSRLLKITAAHPRAMVRSHGLKHARLWFFLAVAAGPIAAPAAVHAQADSAKLYGQFCAKCHGADGTGKLARGIEPAIPDFTAAAWQMKRSDKHLLDSILDGKGETMPAFRTRGKISEQQASGLVTYVRAFAPIQKKSNRLEANESASADFERRFRRLQEELEALQKQFRQLSEASPLSKPSPKASPAAAPGKPTESEPPASFESSAPVLRHLSVPE